MTPKEKAVELVIKFFINLNASVDLHIVGKRKKHAKQCALIAVDEILKAVTTIADKKYDYWREIKKEIEKL